MNYSKRRCFISYKSNPETEKFASRLKSEIQKHTLLGKYLEPWFARDDLRYESHSNAWKDAVREAFFCIYVIDPDFVSSSACLNELQIGISRQETWRKRLKYPNLRTIFAIQPDRAFNFPPEISDSIFIEQYTTPLLQSMEAQLKSVSPQLSDNPFSLGDWPSRAVNQDGTLDIAIIIGSTGKEAPLGSTLEEKEKLLAPFMPFLGSNENTRPQSARVAEYLPYLTSCLERVSRAKMKSFGIANYEESASIPEVYCDRTLFAHFQSVVQEKNIITIGGGDTNLFSRYIHRFYQDQLPIYLNDPADSSELIFSTREENDAGPKLIKYSTAEDQQWFYGLITIRPNPLNPSKFVVWVAGLTALGTQAGIMLLSDMPKGLYTSYYRDTVAYKGDDEGIWRAKGYTIV